MSHVKTGHQGTPCRCTNAAAAVRIGETHTFGSQSVNVWSLENAAVTTGIVVAHIIDDDEQNVGLGYIIGGEGR